MSMFTSQRYYVDGARRSSGTVEHSQTAILEINSTQHNVLKERATSSGMHHVSSPNSSAMGPAAENLRASSTPATSTEQSPLLKPLHSMRSVPSLLEIYNNGFYNNSSYLPEHNMSFGDSSNTIRFQVVVWHIGTIDLVQARVPITFRLTIFWNSLSDDDLDGPPDTSSCSQKSQKALRMLGRQKAFYCDKIIPETTIEVPAVSILNVVTFDTIGDPEVTVLNEDSRLMRWSCMYRATLFQEHWEVLDFPHDEHEISLRLALLAQRQPGAQWDRTVWKLGLATADDVQGSVRAPEGLVVDHVSIPGFMYNQAEGLNFEFKPLDHGPGGGSANDTYLNVKLRVLRNSSYYDLNIIPLLAMLNFVAISITFLEAQRFFERGLLTLNITFVEIGMRMTTDSKLPTAFHQIKIQRILNEYFFGLLFLVLESLLVYELNEWGYHITIVVDRLAALAVFSHNMFTVVSYYRDAHRARERILSKPQPKKKYLQK